MPRPKHPLPPLDFDAIVDSIADRVAQKILARSPQHSPSADDPLLLSVEQAASKLGAPSPRSSTSSASTGFRSFALIGAYFWTIATS